MKPEIDRASPHKNTICVHENNESKASCWRLIADAGNMDEDHAPPLVTVIITAHNYAKYVHQCIQSVRAQSYSHFECIIVDDASTDNTKAVAQSTIAQWANHDRRFSLISTDNNLGQLGAQSFAFARSKGQFIVFLDADDLLKPRFLEYHLFAHLNLAMPVGFTTSDQWTIEADGTVISFHHPDLIAGTLCGAGQKVSISSDERMFNVLAFPRREPESLFRAWWWGTQSTMMFRRGILEFVLPEAADAASFRVCADSYIVHFALLLGGAAILPRPLGSYRRHGNNNFCSHLLLAEDIPVGDMRRHPSEHAFYSLAWRILNQRNEHFIGALGERRYSHLVAEFRKKLKTSGYSDPMAKAAKMKLRNLRVRNFIRSLAASRHA
jgi:glycosyltransferase involved in cell wall biosynthesis